MAGFKGIVIALLLAGVFAFSIISFGVQMQLDNDAGFTLLNNTRINSSYTSLGSDLNRTQSVYAEQSSDFSSDQPEESRGGESILLISIVGVLNVVGKIPVLLYDSTLGLAFDVLFGGSSNTGFGIVFGIFGAILIISLVLYAWKVIRTGDPE